MEKQNNNIETYTKDMLHILENGGDGIVKKIIHQEEERENLKKGIHKTSLQNKFFIFGGSILILLAFLSIIFFFFNRVLYIIDVPVQFTPIVFLDKSSFLEISDLSKDKIVNIISNKVNMSQVKNGGVEGIYLTENKKVIGYKRFLSLIEGDLGQNNTNIIKDNFLLGLVKQENINNQNLFILMKVLSFTDAFPIMQTWENKMFLNLHRFFDIDITPENEYLLNTNFKDGIIQNKNARILYDKNNQIVFMYVYIDETSIIITNTENVVREIIIRLTSSKVGK